jgi:uncharacterized protein YbaA (DUF1428 family)
MEYHARVDGVVYGPSKDRIGLIRAIATRHGLQICADDGLVRFEGEVETVEALFDALMRLGDIDFEITSTSEFERRRLVYAWGLGAGSATVDALGNVVLSEPRIQSLLGKSNFNLIEFQRSLREVSLTAWEDVFERARLGHLQDANRDRKTNVA